MEEKSLYDILAYYGMPDENIESAITQIAQGYGACRYLEGVASGAEATGKGSGFVPLCTAKIVWKDEGNGRAFPRFEDEIIFDQALVPSLAMEIGEIVSIYMRRIDYDRH